MFKIKNVSKHYNGEFALQDVSMNIGKGLNFIVGASGSGKTTLLKIMSGMEQDFVGDVTYCGKHIKTLSSTEKSYLYNNVFGFVWQDFHLLEDRSVVENIRLPQYLKEGPDDNAIEKILKDLKIHNIADKKVKLLSGGQKQRVAIARELMKQPQVIIADEPTSSLDEKASKNIMAILRAISKSRTVIIVTHDTSFITDKDYVYELDKGELVNTCERLDENAVMQITKKPQRLSLKNACSVGKSNTKNKVGRFMISTLSIVIASVLLLSLLGGTIKGSSQGEFDQLIDTYGESLCDLSIINSFIDAAGTDGENEKKPNGNVTQDIRGLYERYATDERVSFIAYLQAFENIEITLDNKNYNIQSSGNSASINKLVAGEMPMGNEHEIVVPESFVEKLGIRNEQAIGKEIDFKGSIYNWSSGEPIPKNINTKAKIVGVMDTTVTYEYEGKVMSYTLDDSFFFSKPALDEMLNQAGNSAENNNFMIRAKTPNDMIAIKDELSEKGIVPLGQFELVEDMVRLNNQTTEQSGFASILIGVLSFILVIVVFLITGFMRKKEYAIFKINGFKNSHLFLVTGVETVFMAVFASVIMMVSFLVMNTFAKGSLGNTTMLYVGILLVLITSIIAYVTTIITFIKQNIDKALKLGD